MLGINLQLCTSCGECTYECHTGAIRKKQGQYYIDADNCVLCEACIDICESEAIQNIE